MRMLRLVGVVAPVFNEAECILDFIKQITEESDNN